MIELTSRTRLAFLLLSACVLIACSHPPKRPPGVAPTPKTVTREEPGGDAFDPHQAALERLVSESWGWRDDRKAVFHFPLSDWRIWRRVRFWGVPTFVGFRYGDRHRAIAGMWLRRVHADDPATPQGCIARFEKWCTPMVDAYSVEVKDQVQELQTWRTKDDVLVRTLEAEVQTLLSRRRYFGVVGAALPWPDVCAVYGYAFEIDEDEALARKARDRYAREAYKQLGRMTDRPPDGIE